MQQLDPLSITATLQRAGAEAVTVKKLKLPYLLMERSGKRGEFLAFGFFAFFFYRGIGHAWRIRLDGHVQNFERDVARELGANSDQRV